MVEDKEYVNSNAYLDEIKKFIGSEVVVTYYEGDEIKTLEGTLKALQFNYLHLVIMTKTDKVLLKNFVKITRKRKSDILPRLKSRASNGRNCEVTVRI